MYLNAKAFCLIAALLFCATVGWCVYQINTPLEPIKDGAGKLPEPPAPWMIGILGFVTDQLNGGDVSIPMVPFLPTMEAILADENNRADIIAAINNARNNPPGAAGGNRADPFAALRPGGGGGQRGGPNAGGGGTPGVADTGPKMITPKISFLGFMKRSDGSRVAMFSNSANNSTVFYTPGKKVHGLEILSADMKEAVVRRPDGTEEIIPIGKSVELAPEPETQG